MAAHRYWRIEITALGPGYTYPGIATLEMYTSVGGSTVCSGGTASASSTYIGYPASNAFDGNSSTWWYAAAASTLPQWLQYDFGAGNDKDIVEFGILAGSGGYRYIPVDFSIKYSDDGTNFSTSASFKSIYLIPGSLCKFRAVNSSKEFWRIYITTASNGDPGLAEIEFHTSIGGSDICSGGVTGYSTYNTTYVPTNAFDDSSSTYWFANASVPQWVGYYTGTTNDVVEFTIRNYPSASNYYEPKDFSLEYSSDGGVTWSTVQSWTGIDFNNAGETRTFAVGSNTQLTPSVGAISVVGQVPSVSWSIVPNSGSVLVLGEMPGISQGTDQNLTPTAGSIVVLGEIPGWTQGINQSLTPVEGSVIYAGEVPGVAPNATQFEPSVGSIVYLGYRPGVGQSGTAGGDYRFFFG